MGIITNAKQYLSEKVTSAVNKATDGVVKHAALSPKQVETIDEKRNEYLAGKEDMTGEETQEFIEHQLGAVGIEVYQAYLEQIKTLYQPVDIAMEQFDDLNRIRYFDITKWVTDPSERNLDKLVNVYQVLSGGSCNVALIYDRKQSDTRVVMAVSNTDMTQADPARVDSFRARLASAIKGNFPGAEILEKPNDNSYGSGIPNCLQTAIQSAEQDMAAKSVAIVSNLASEKSENFISQSMEKLLDGIVPESEHKEYTIVLLAKPISDQLTMRNRLFELYSVLAPYASWQTNYSYTESEAMGKSAAVSVNLGTNVARHSGKNKSASLPVGGVNCSMSKNSGKSVGVNFGVNFAQTASVTAQIGKNEGLTQSYTNFGVKHTLDVIEKQLARIDATAALGMWDFAAYVLAQSPVIANNVAHMYLALTQGDDSYMTRAAVNLWDGQEEKDTATAILKSVQRLCHPVFGLKETSDGETLLFPTLVTHSTVLSGKELAKAMNFPRKSVAGFPVTESAAFGRSISRLDDNAGTSELDVGSIWHMRRDDGGRVVLNENLLTSHVFITGSTGSGKSNTVYQLLDKLCTQGSGKHFLVVEPTKGEYKAVFGGREDVSVYGTNYRKTKLLRLNPFSFPEGVQLFSHLDRLTEIFNACWPMYAAMPAVLKDAMERAYAEAGWDVRTSENQKYGRLFPTFTDVLRQIDLVMDESDYSGDSRGDYKGALKTRLKSLTNGIYSDVFGCDELSEAELFDRNVIVDLSEIGPETTSLIMGMLVLKLQEYRMASNAMNAELKHITVLEEAHNLLKRTSTEQTSESANLTGKSVEMITNAIAEMRTYGECFMIVDQAPGALNPAAIRNTNTKIVLRLPDYSDRELVGKSIGLNEYQITELGKLERGVAAVYQSGWIESVLCRFDEFKKKQENAYTTDDYKPNHSAAILLNAVLYGAQVSEFASVIKSLKDTLIYKSALSLPLKRQIWDACASDEPIGKEHLAGIAYELLNADVLYAKSDKPSESEVARQFRLTMQRYQIADLALNPENLKILNELLDLEHHQRESNFVYGAFMGGVR